MADEKPTLRGCWAKIERAREHAYRLEELAERFLKRRPNQVFFDDHSDPEWVIVRATVEPMPLTFSAIAGDLVQNLRSALDLLAWQLVLVEGGDPGRQTYFPIYRSKDDFDERVRNPTKNVKSPLDGLDPAGQIWTQIERVQPYNSGYEDLWRIASFSNRDKHQGLLAAVSYVHGFAVDDLIAVSGVLDTPEVRLTFTEADVLEHGAEILRVRKTTGLGMKMKTDPPVQIGLSDGEVAMGIEALDKLRGHAVQVIRAFESFF